MAEQIQKNEDRLRPTSFAERMYRKLASTEIGAKVDRAIGEWRSPVDDQAGQKEVSQLDPGVHSNWDLEKQVEYLIHRDVQDANRSGDEIGVPRDTQDTYTSGYIDGARAVVEMIKSNAINPEAHRRLQESYEKSPVAPAQTLTRKMEISGR